MKRNRRVFYTVEIPHHWYSYQSRGWIHEEDIPKKYGVYASSQVFKTCKVFAKPWPKGTVITEWFYKKGIRYCTFYE